MCGIAGGFWRAPATSINQLVEVALSAMQRRGPDHQGYDCHVIPQGTIVLGHTRLSIIDLSSAAQQPMYSEDRRFGVVFNGEIYNYLEIRTELEGLGVQFFTRSDTEVLLEAWAKWGAKALARFKGMFAFAVFDRMHETLTFVRDQFGIKPFFYAYEAGGVQFASEIHALRVLKRERAQLNWQRAYDYLVHGEYDFGEESFIDGILNLMPGHMLCIDLNNPLASEPVAWWRPSIAPCEPISFASASDLLREKFLANIRLHLRSDVPLGAALSGGIDSSAIVCAMRYLEPDANIHTFSYIARDSQVSEESWVDKVNQYTNAVPHKTLVSGKELALDLEDLIATQGEPFGGTSIYAQYRVFKLAKEHGVTVTLEGQGADEIMGGYNGYPGQRIHSLIDQGQYAQAWAFLNQWATWPGRSRLEGLKRVVGEYSTGWLNNALRNLNGMENLPGWIRPGPLLESGVSMVFPEIKSPYEQPGRRMMADLATSLSQRGLLGLLRHGDRNSMRFSVESRVPFLTADLSEFMLSLPEEYLVSPRGQTKRLLRAAMRGIVPDEILERRDKVGFATPEKQWLLEMTDTIRVWLSEDLKLPFLNQSVLLMHFEEVAIGRRPFTWQVWRWINFFQWYKGLQ
jgi:asparagine synthase (glutamine-hydrolysing)